MQEYYKEMTKYYNAQIVRVILIDSAQDVLKCVIIEYIRSFW